MVTVSEVVVGLRAEGAEDTKDDLEGVSDKTEETTQQLDEQSESLTELAQSFSGALQAATVGLAAASAGLLSQIPVLGQVFDSLFAVVQALALSMDSVLRPVLGPVSRGFFAIAQGINKLSGPANAILGILTTLSAIIIGVQAAALQFTGSLISLSAVWGALTTAGSAVVGILSAIAGAISLPAVAVAALVAAIGAAIAVILTDFRGWRTQGIKIIKDLWRRLKQIVLAGVNRIKEFGSNMFQAGIGLIDRLVAGIISAKNKVINAVQDIIASTPLPNLGVGANVGTAGVSGSLGSGSTSGTSSSSRTLPGSQTTTTQVFLDGRQIGQGTSGERFDESARRGQTF